MIEQAGLRPGVDFDAVAGTEYYFATHAMRVMHDLGINVPEQVAVVGFNDSQLNVAVTPTLTTMRKPFFESGFRAVEICLELAAGKEIPRKRWFQGDWCCAIRAACVSRAILEAGQRVIDPPGGGLPALFSRASSDSRRSNGGLAAPVRAAFESDLEGRSQFSFIKMITETAFPGQHPDVTFESGSACSNVCASTSWRQSMLPAYRRPKPC